MSPDKGKEAPKEIEQDALPTKAEVIAQMQQLTERAREAWLNPIKALAQTYVKQGRVILEGILDSLENDKGSKKKKE